ncbi:MAG: rhodanese-like domain-containing protein [bacterium]
MEIHDLLTHKRLRDLGEMVSEIGPEDLKAKLENFETFQLVEVSNPDDFTKSHIEGAMNIPLLELKETAQKKFRKFQQIVVYCQAASSTVGAVAARTLQELGFYNVLMLTGGKEGWRECGFPLQEDLPKLLES